MFSKFIEDAKIQQEKYPDLHLIFSGDLVQSGENTEQYKNFLAEIADGFNQVGIPVERRICIPGNHDVSREALKKKVRSCRGALEALRSEEDFLEELPSLSELYFKHKFTNYIDTEKKFAGMGCCQTNIGGTGWHIGEKLGIYCLNTALCSFGGITDPSTALPINDKEKLCVDTRLLHQWDQSSKAEKKILVMHHLLDWLSEWSRSELERLFCEKFSLVFCGHLHKGDALLNQRVGGSTVFCKAPALFTRKADTLGYSIVSLNTDSDEVEILYRQWTGQKFVLGTNLANHDSGVVVFGSSALSESKFIAVESDTNCQSSTSEILEAEFRDSSTSYSSKRQLWVDRDLSKHPETDSNRNNGESIELSAVYKNLKSCIIRAPKEFGLTCTGRYIALHSYKESEGKSILAMCDADKIPPHRHGLLTYLNTRADGLKCLKSKFAGLILDNWHDVKYADKLLRVIKEEFPNMPVIILHGIEDFNDLRNPAVITQDDGFDQYYLRSLSLSRVRELVCDYLESSNSHLDPDVVTRKIVEDIDALNTHRTPLNCLFLLKLVERHFDESPVNRTEVIKKILVVLFHEFDQIPKYSSRPDLTDCEYALGYLCEWMLRSNKHSFRREEFFEKVHEYCKKQLITFDCDVLFNFLCTENILIRRGIDFGFRLVYWRFYFTAIRMHHDAKFAEFILSDSRYTAFPEVIEFYTGIDRRRTDAVSQLTSDLRRMDNEFLARTGIGNDFNPFLAARWNPSTEAIDQMKKEVDESIKESALPSEVKDAVADGTYDRSKPYHQDVGEWLKTSTLGQMIQATKAAARALRNSDHVSPEAKKELFDAVLTSWTRLCQILALISPILASNKKASFEGMGFILDDSFGDETNVISIWQTVMTVIADNVVSWHQLDLFSKKLGPLFQDYINNNEGKIGEMLVLLVLIHQRPAGWREIVDAFILRADKNSLYLNRVYHVLLHELRYSFSNEAVRQQIRLLAAKAIARHGSKVKNPNQTLIAKAARYIDEQVNQDEANLETDKED